MVLKMSEKIAFSLALHTAPVDIAHDMNIFGQTDNLVYLQKVLK